MSSGHISNILPETNATSDIAPLMSTICSHVQSQKKSVSIYHGKLIDKLGVINLCCHERSNSLTFQSGEWLLEVEIIEHSAPIVRQSVDSLCIESLD